MSQHSCQTRNTGGELVSVLMGYDRPLDYVFCTVASSDGTIIYCNLDDPQAGTDQQDVRYYQSILERLHIAVPESMYLETARDQEERIGNRYVVHSATCANRSPG